MLTLPLLLLHRYTNIIRNITWLPHFAKEALVLFVNSRALALLVWMLSLWLVVSMCFKVPPLLQHASPLNEPVRNLHHCVVHTIHGERVCVIGGMSAASGSVVQLGQAQSSILTTSSSAPHSDSLTLAQSSDISNGGQLSLVWGLASGCADADAAKLSDSRPTSLMAHVSLTSPSMHSHVSVETDAHHPALILQHDSVVCGVADIHHVSDSPPASISAPVTETPAIAVKQVI